MKDTNGDFSNEVKARAFGILASATAAASIIGPLLGGAKTHSKLLYLQDVSEKRTKLSF